MTEKRWLTQWVECFLYTEEVSGSNLLSLMLIRYFKEGIEDDFYLVMSLLLHGKRFEDIKVLLDAIEL